MIKQHMKGESCTTGRSVVLRAENGSTRENQEVNRGETESSDSRSSCKTNYGIAENLFQHIQTESRGGHEHSCETRRETELSSCKPSRKISSTTQKEKFKNSVSSKACCRSYESRENSNEHFSVNPWAILDRPHTAGQGETHQIEIDKEFEIEKCNGEENTELRFNTRMKTQPARGHIVHSWDVLLDMGTQGLEITLPQLLEGSCKSQTVSSLSFGTKGGKSVDLDIITNLGENYYVECGRGAIIARRCMKQRYIELGFTKTVSSGRAIYINNLVTVGPSKPVLTARVIEHAQREEESRGRRASNGESRKRRQQMTAMGIMWWEA